MKWHEVTSEALFPTNTLFLFKKKLEFIPGVSESTEEPNSVLLLQGRTRRRQWRRWWMEALSRSWANHWSRATVWRKALSLWRRSLKLVSTASLLSFWDRQSCHQQKRLQRQEGWQDAECFLICWWHCQARGVFLPRAVNDQKQLNRRVNCEHPLARRCFHNADHYPSQGLAHLLRLRPAGSCPLIFPGKKTAQRVETSTNVAEASHREFKKPFCCSKISFEGIDIHNYVCSLVLVKLILDGRYPWSWCRPDDMGSTTIARSGVSEHSSNFFRVQWSHLLLQRSATSQVCFRVLLMREEYA